MVPTYKFMPEASPGGYLALRGLDLFQIYDIQIPRTIALLEFPAGYLDPNTPGGSEVLELMNSSLQLSGILAHGRHSTLPMNVP